MSDFNGEFVWYDLMTTDVEAAKSFYGDIIGWGNQQWDGGPTPYTMWTVKDKTIGGLMELPEQAQSSGAPPHWLAYVGASDIEATFKKVQELGGTPYVPPTEIPSIGKFCIFADPQGGVMAAYSSADDSPHEKQGGPGHFSWHELMSTDVDASIAFYEKLFGWNKTEAMDMGEAGTYQMYGKGSNSMGGMMKKPDIIPGPSTWLFYITVSDIKGAVEKVKAKGGQLLNGPMEVPGGDQVAQCLDPQGAAFALHEKASS